MKPLLILLIGLCLATTVKAQKTYFQTPEIIKLVQDADACYKAKEEGCDVLYKKAIAGIKDQSKDDLDLVIHKLCMYYYSKNQNDSLKKYLEYGIQHARKGEAIEAFLNLKSHILFNEGHLDEAAEAMVTLARRMEPQQDKKDKLAYIYADLGNVYAAQDDQESSLTYLLKSHKILVDLGDSILIATVTGYVADAYMNLRQDSLARVWAVQTLQLPKTQKENEGKTLAYITMARLLSTVNPDSALYYADKAEALALQEKDQLSLARTSGYKARILKHMGRLQQAQAEIDKSVTLNKALHFLPGLVSVLKDGGAISLLNKQYEKAARYFQDHIELADSLKSRQRYETLGELTVKYETEKKERKLAQQELIIQRKNAMVRNALTAGLLILITATLLLWQFRRNHRQKMKTIAQEQENAVLKAWMNGEERERNRISKDLHDGVAAMIGAARMSLQAIPYLDAEKQKTQLEKVSQLLDHTHGDVRRIAHDLLPLTLEKEGLLAAIRQFACDLNQMGVLQLSVEDQLTGQLQLDAKTELMLFRIVQELVNNILRHAQASTARICLSAQPGWLQIDVEDNGRGFNGGSENQGLYSIRERLRALGGVFDIEGAPQGTKASLRLQYGAG